VPIEFCVTPQGTTASGPYFQDAPPSQAVDANKITTWTSGGYQGTLTVVLPAPTPMASVVLLPNGSWSPVPGVMYFTVIAKDANNQTRTLSGQFTDQNPTAWVELPLPAPMNIKEISISGQSGESWIGIWEVMYRSCAP
jgi:hypothetical protein